jgi:hypothetical protein
MSEQNKFTEEELARLAELDAREQAIRSGQAESSNIEDVEAVEDVIEKQGLGSVNMANFAPQKAESSDSILGWMVLDQETLPSRGKFYPADCVIKIRSARAKEIRHFSTMDENSYIDMEEKLNSIVESCAQLTTSTIRMTYKDILEEDRVIILLAIRDLTFPEPEQKLMLKGKTDKTKRTVDIELSTKYLVPTEVPEEIETYYDSRERTYVIKTRSAGVVRMKPPTIGAMEKITAYLRDRQEKDIEFDKAFVQVLPYIQPKWQDLSLTKIFQAEIDYKGWDEKKFMVIYRLAEKMRIGVHTTLEMEFDGEIAKAPLEFPGGIKSLFIISDLAGELL